MVQVDSKDDEPETRTEKSVQRVKERLAKMGFTEEQVAVHTAKEPDSGPSRWPMTSGAKC